MLVDFKIGSGQLINKKECPIHFSSNIDEETKSMLRKIVHVFPHKKNCTGTEGSLGAS